MQTSKTIVFGILAAAVASMILVAGGGGASSNYCIYQVQALLCEYEHN